MKLKKILPDVVALLAFIVLSFAYFFPADIEGRILFQHDSAAGVGAGQEAATYYEQTGERTRWTNSLFGGMPTYQISPSYDSTQPLSWAGKVYQLFLPDYVCLTFMMLLGFYILLRALALPVWLSALGAVLWAFSSYFFILISAGHIWKYITLAYIPPTLAGIILAYRGRLLWGGVLTALFLALQVLSNHVQMSYYFLFVILFLVAAYFVKAYRENTLPQFFKASAVLLVAALVGVAANLSNLYHTYTYSKETMRGKSELVHTGDAAQQTSSGLNRDYITQWSYGIGETWTLLVPNYKGGASVPLTESETAMQKANPRYAPLYSQLTQYFGDQPMTAGPVYVGAFVLFLFLLGCVVVKGPFKWALVGATLFSILLEFIQTEVPRMLREGISLKVFGDIDGLPLAVRTALKLAIKTTARGRDMDLNLALNYGSRGEIVRAVKNMMADGLKPEDVTEERISAYLYSAGQPDPDLVIRTSGEQRLSNFLLYQCAYSEFYFTSKPWPAFDKESLDQALYDYAHRQRRFGKTQEQVDEQKGRV